MRAIEDVDGAILAVIEMPSFRHMTGATPFNWPLTVTSETNA